MKQVFKFTRILGLCLFLFGIHTVQAQTPNPQNLSNVRVSELSDAQIRAFIRQVESTGLSDAQLEQVAMARGMSQDEVQKLRIRVEQLKKADVSKAATTKKQTLPDAPKLNTARKTTTTGVPDSVENTNPQTQAEMALLELKNKIFGASLFKNSSITFEPNLRLATPANYILGPDDELGIEITGYNEASYILPISPEGTIKVEYVGLISVSGLTVQAATERIKSRLAKTYPAIASGKSQVTIVLGNIRSIKVTVLGEAFKPGSFTLPSLATAFNALYAAGGPTENGSLRQIEIIRNNKIIRVLDVYDFLMRGDQKNNLRLQDQDIIRIPPYRGRVEFLGEIKRPAIFEVLPGENLAQLLDFAGGFTESAYSSRIKVLQNTDKERRIADVFAADFKTYMPKMGDKFYVEPIIDRFENRVYIEGAVFRPGDYALTPGLTLSQVIKQAEGLKEDAFMGRAYLTRLKPDNSFELIAFDLAQLINGTAQDIPLKREDQIKIVSIFDLQDEYKLTIDGAVRQKGDYKYAENTSLEDLILQAGGFTQAGIAKRVEVARRLKNDAQDANYSLKTADIFQIDVDPDLKFSTQQFKLQPFDIINVRNAPGYDVQRQVQVKGEVLYPGTYTLSNNTEKISDIVWRAGGLTSAAYVKGAFLDRPGAKVILKENTVELNAVQEQKKLSRLQLGVLDTTAVNQVPQTEAATTVGIKLKNILANPNSSLNLILQDGDILNIPKELQTVKVSGEVLAPITVVFRAGTGLKQYVSQAGGTTNRALLKRSFVIYANGAVKGTRKPLFLNWYPKITPGAEIYVPQRSEKNKLSSQELLGLTSGIASLGAIILGIINLSK
jgi:protein involved in polysaccharide export with SLBB domain